MITYVQYVEARIVVAELQADSADSVTDVEARLNQVFPGLSNALRANFESVSRLRHDADDGVGAATVHLASLVCEGDGAAAQLREYEARAGAEGDADADDDGGGGGDDDDLEFLSRDAYLQYREIFFRISGNHHHMAKRTKDMELAVLLKSEDELAELRTLFGHLPDLANRSVFKSVDKDRTGMISAAELLRAMLPGVSKHLVKHAMRTYEHAWKEYKKQLLDEAAAALAEERAVLAEEEEEEDPDEDDGDGESSEEPVAVSGETYVFCKEMFEAIDVDGSGEITCTELQKFIDTNPSPFMSKVNWKYLDKDRNGFVSFVEFVRCLHPTAHPWRVRKDIAINEKIHGKVASAKKKQKKKRQLSVMEGMQSVSAARLGVFDRRIRDLEESYSKAERDLRSFERSVSRNSSERVFLTPGDQQTLNNKLYYQQMDRQAKQDERRQAKLHEEQVCTQGRWVNQAKLPQDSIDALNTRLYDDSVASKQDKMQSLADTFIAEPAPARTIDADTLQVSLQRLYTADLAVRQEKRDALRHKYMSGPPTRCVSPAVTVATAQRLFETCEEKKQRRDSYLRKKYLTSTELPKVKLSKNAQKKMITRLHG